MVDVFLGVGSNVGDSVNMVLSLFNEVRSWKGIDTPRFSSLYQTSPWGLVSQKKFINAVLSFQTDRSAKDIFFQSMQLEKKYGRLRHKEKRWGPRIVDIDLLAYGQKVIQTKNLTVPHPLLHERLFVLYPWNEINSNWKHPLIKQTIKDLFECKKKSDTVAKIQKIFPCCQAGF